MSTQLLGIAFVVLESFFGLLFFIIAILSVIQLIRSNRLRKQNELLSNSNEPRSILVQLYYGFLILLSLLQAIFQVWFSVLSYTYINDQNQKNQNNNELIMEANKLFNFGNYIPDSIFFICYNLVFSQMVLYNEYAHIKYGNMLQNRHTLAVARTFNVPKRLQVGLAIYICVQVAHIIKIQIGIILSYHFNVISVSILNFIDLIINGSLPILLIIYLIYNSRKYAGAPTRSQSAENQIISLRNILIYFSVGRVLQCIQNYLLASQSSEAFQILTSNSKNQSDILNSWIFFGIVVVEVLVCQIIPFVVTLQDKYVKILGITFYEDKLLSLDNIVKINRQDIPMSERSDTVHRFSPINRGSGKQENGTNDISEESALYDMDRTKLSITDYKNKLIIQINIDEITLEGPFKQPSVSQIQLGELLKGTVKAGKYQDKVFIIRKLQIKRLSQYLIEEMNKNIQEYRTLSCKYIQPIKALSFDQENVYFFTPYFDRGNLYTVINQTSEVDIQTKKAILLNIAKGMAYLYSQNPPISHGHLTPNNIMMTKTGDYRVIDFGLTALKKYVALITGYSTKCQYTYKTIMRDRSLTPSFNQQSDIYAFGMIAWEVVHQKQAFKGLNIQELQVKVGDEKKRPKIDENVDDALATIIRSCWQDVPDKRPRFDLIVRSLLGLETMSLELEA